MAIAGDPRLGIAPTEPSRTVVVDYSGPNIAKEMHVGHLRSTIIGDAISRVLEFEGDRVIRQNHIGDWGTQFGMLIAFLGDSNDMAIADLEAMYVAAKRRFDDDAAFADESRRRVVNLQGGKAEEVAKWKLIVDETRKHYQPVYETLGVLLKPEHERGESTYNALLGDVVADLKAKGLAVESEGAVAVFIDGPDKNPLLIEKTGGGYLYATTDLAALRYRIGTLHADRVIYTHDARQAQHFAQVFATARKAGWAQGVQLDYAPFGTMLGADTKPFKTRDGSTIKLRNLLEEAQRRALAIVEEKNPELSPQRKQAIARAVGIGAVKYADLSKDRISDYIFSWETMLSLVGNTAPYLQYAHARVRSILRKAAADPAAPPAAGGKIILEAPQELALAKHTLRLGDIIALVARELKPHYLCTYLYELAGLFSSFFESCPVIQSEEPTRGSRLILCRAVGDTLARGLDLLGIEHPDQM
jgi:arginyl-tRNA synthetase